MSPIAGLRSMPSPSDPSHQISVICPTFNSESYIKRALSSVLHQEEAPDQVIFCDDGSIDNTVSILKDWKQKFCDRGIDVIVKTFSHRGPGAARNHGLDLAKYSWVAFLDADDSWDGSKLKRVRTAIKKSIEINFILHWEEKQHLDGHKSLLRHGEEYRTGASLSRLLYRKNIFSTVSSKILPFMIGGRRTRFFKATHNALGASSSSSESESVHSDRGDTLPESDSVFPHKVMVFLNV